MGIGARRPRMALLLMTDLLVTSVTAAVTSAGNISDTLWRLQACEINRANTGFVEGQGSEQRP